MVKVVGNYYGAALMWRRYPARHISERDLARSTIYNEVITSYGVLITMSRTDGELLRDALEVLVFSRINSPSLIEEIRARLAEPEPEPIGWYEQTPNGDWFLAYSFNPEAKTFPLYRHSPRPVRLSDEEILALAGKYGTSETRERLLFRLEDGEPNGDTYPQTDWEFGQEDLLGFARELLGKNQ